VVKNRDIINQIQTYYLKINFEEYFSICNNYSDQVWLYWKRF